MRAAHCVRWMLVCGLLAITPLGTVRGESPTDVEKKKERQKRVDRMIEESLASYQFFAEPNSRTMLRAHSVLRWVNDSREFQQGEATFVLWTDGGRPEASASIYPWNGYLAHEFVSLSRGTTLVAKERDRVFWAPRSAGLTFRDIPDAPAPAELPAARLAQMRALAARFKVIMTGWRPDDSDREELRVLPKSIYRYELKDSKPAHGLEDGAVFAFVQGTDPEAILLLEAVNRDSRSRWQYAFGRATSGGLEARLGAAVVWTAPRMTSQANPALPTYFISRPLRD